MRFILIFLFVLILAAVIGWHAIFAIIGGTIVIGAGIWAVAVISIVIFCAAILFLFFITGLGAFIIGGIFAVWTLLAIIFFPILFPLLLPLLIVLGFISYVRKRQIEHKKIEP